MKQKKKSKGINGTKFDRFVGVEHQKRRIFWQKTIYTNKINEINSLIRDLWHTEQNISI